MANGHFKKIAHYARLSESQLVAAMLLFAMRRWALVFSRCPNNLLPITTKETLENPPGHPYRPDAAKEARAGWHQKSVPAKVCLFGGKSSQFKDGGNPLFCLDRHQMHPLGQIPVGLHLFSSYGDPLGCGIGR